MGGWPEGGGLAHAPARATSAFWLRGVPTALSQSGQRIRSTHTRTRTHLGRRLDVVEEDDLGAVAGGFLGRGHAAAAAADDGEVIVIHARGGPLCGGHVGRGD